MSTSSTAGRRPSHRLYMVTGEGDAANWTQLGAAWPNKDGKGFNLLFEAMPLSGRLVMREVPEKDETEGEP